MTNQHKKVVLEMFPKLQGKTYTLKEYVNKEVVYKDVDDPWGYSLEIYEECAKEIVENIDKLLEKF